MDYDRMRSLLHALQRRLTERPRIPGVDDYVEAIDHALSLAAQSAGRAEVIADLRERLTEAEAKR